ncbi:zinc finger BED domain-containing protein RICESLEEPER 2 [Tanacetum coccineum]
MFPVLSRMAMDIISVQASSVASESAFSTSGRVLSIRRTRLTPASLEMCMCLKDHLDAKERKQDKCLLETPLDFEEDVFDDEVQQNESIPLSDEEIALDASSEGIMSPGRPRVTSSRNSITTNVKQIVLMTIDEMIGKNWIQDIRWLCSLSESELDLLISLKKMAIQ